MRPITTKNSIVLLMTALLTAGFISSCTRAEIYASDSETEAHAPNPEKTLVTFRAVHADRTDTKTLIQEDGKVLWDSHEDISLFYGSDFSAKFSWTGADGETYKSAEFNGSLDSIDYSASDRFIAVYPYSDDTSFDGELVTLTLPDAQNAIPGTFDDNLFIMLAETEDYYLHFRHLCGGVRFSLKESGIRSVTFKGKNGEPLAGTVKVGLDADEIPYVAEVTDPKTQITLSPPEGETFTAGQWYYLVALPTALSDGYSMILSKDDGTFAVKTSSSSVNIRRAFWGQLTEADNSLPYGNWDEIRYTSSDGQIVEPHDSSAFDANIISNTYFTTKADDGGYGILKFDGPVTRIGDGAFTDRSTLKSITIPEYATTIGKWAFAGCASLESIYIPESVTSVENRAFINSPNLKAISGKSASEDGRCLIIDGVLKVFAPSGLTSYEIPSSVIYIDFWAFYNCSYLESITIPESVKNIEGWAFDGCSGLKSVTISESVTSIGTWAFAGCASLESITIPESVTTIETGIFTGCHNLKVIYGKFASEDGRCLIDEEGKLKTFAPAGLTSYEIPSSATSIVSKAFDGLTELTRITIPESVKNIESSAFNYCTNLTAVYVNSVTPPTAGSAIFDGCPRIAIYVPDESFENYKAAEGWSDYADLFHMKSLGAGSTTEDTGFWEWE